MHFYFRICDENWPNNNKKKTSQTYNINRLNLVDQADSWCQYFFIIYKRNNLSQQQVYDCNACGFLHLQPASYFESRTGSGVCVDGVRADGAQWGCWQWLAGVIAGAET